MTHFEIKRFKNYGIISPVPDGKLSSMLNSKMSYKRQGAEFMPRPEWSIVRLYNAKKGTFPWGLRHLVEDIMQSWKKYSGDTYFQNNFTPAQFESIENDKLRSYQKDAVISLLNNRGGILSIPTGGGKTLTAIEYLKLFKGRKKLIIVPTLDIKKMWEEKVRDYIDHCIVINHQNPLAKEYAKIFDIIVFDECHHVAARTIYNIAMQCKSDSILVGLSATVSRDDGEDLKVFGALGKIVYHITRRELIDQGYLSDAIVHYYRPKFDTKGDFMLDYAQLYKKHIVENEDRNGMIISYADLCANANLKVLVLVTQIEHGQHIFNSLDTNKKIFCHGNSQDRYKNLDDYKIIVATNIFNEGIDLPSLDVVILAAGGKSGTQLTQRVGRVLRISEHKKMARVLDFIDEPKHLNKHYKARRKLLEQDFEVHEY